MKQLWTFLFAFIVASGLSLQANAALSNRGMDSLGNRLIYDSDLNITWYDYTKSAGDGTWQAQMNWVSGLTVNFGGTIFDDWRLPSTVDGPYLYCLSSPANCFNITSSEMGYLYYNELGNKGMYDSSGNLQPGSGLSNKGPFTKLQPHLYWSGTVNATNPAGGASWAFSFASGYQSDYFQESNLYAIAVRPGDVAVVPEPISAILFLTGGATLIGSRYIIRKKHCSECIIIHQK